MTETIDITAGAIHEEEMPQSQAPGNNVPQPQAGRAVIPVELLAAHPGNVRRVVGLDPEFLDSIAELGILTPLRITPTRPAGTGSSRATGGWPPRTNSASPKCPVT